MNGYCIFLIGIKGKERFFEALNADRNFNVRNIRDSSSIPAGKIEYQ